MLLFPSDFSPQQLLKPKLSCVRAYTKFDKQLDKQLVTCITDRDHNLVRQHSCTGLQLTGFIAAWQCRALMIVLVSVDGSIVLAFAGVQSKSMPEKTNVS